MSALNLFAGNRRTVVVLWWNNYEMDGPEQQEMKDVAKEGDLYVVLHRDLLFFSEFVHNSLCFV